MGFKMNMGLWNSVFAVPAKLVDENLKLANETSLKVILYLLRHSDKLFSENELMVATGIKSTSALREAVEFWQERQVISICDEEIVPQSTQSSKGNDDFCQKVEQSIDTAQLKINASVNKVELSRPPRYSPQEISRKIKNSDRSNQVFVLAEKLYSRPLKHSEQQILMEIIEYAALPVDVTMMLLEFCHSIGKTSLHYIHKTAITWAEEEINTIELADSRIKELRAFTYVESKIKREMEYNSVFSKKQKEYISTWTSKLNFSVEMVLLAYQITLDSAGKLSFQYMNKILETWYAKGFTKPEQVENEKQKNKDEKQLENTSSFDVDEVEASILDRYRSADD